jgi:hypothetical protein
VVQGVGIERDLDVEGVREREPCEQVGVREVVQTRVQPRLVAVDDLPIRARRGQAVDGQAIVLDVDERAVHVELDVPARHGVARPVEAIGPGVQQRDPERLGVPHVGVEAVALREELLPAVAQRGADHAGAGGEGGLKVAGGEGHELHGRRKA